MRKQSFWIIQVAVVLMLIKGTGLARDILVPKMYGVDSFSDGFFIGLSLVLTLYALYGKAITLYLMPLLDGSDKDYIVIKGFVYPATFLTCLVCFLYFVHPNWLMSLLYVGTGQEIRVFLDIAVMSMPLVPLFYGLVAFHQIRERFLLTHVYGLIFNCSIIVFTVINNRSLLPWSLMTAMLLQTLWLVSQFDMKLFLRAPVNWQVGTFNIEIILISIVLSFEQLNLFVDRRFISIFNSGYVTVIDLAGKFGFLFLGIAVLSVTTVIYPKLVKMHQFNDHESLRRLITKLLFAMLILSGAATIFIILFGEIVIHFVFGNELESVDFLVFSLKVYAVLLIPLSLREILIRYFILTKRTFGISLLSVFCLVLNWLASSYSSSPEFVLYTTILSVGLNTILTGLYYLIITKRSW